MSKVSHNIDRRYNVISYVTVTQSGDIEKNIECSETDDII